MARPHLIPALHPTERLIGQAPAIAALRTQIRHLATFDTLGNPFVPTVLLQGETGTGKGLVARIIHDSGPRAQGPFLEVNCAAIPESLLEAELFGFAAGAFTDAKRAKPGLFEAASRGTLFLDEIDSLPPTLQSKLLTVIEAKRAPAGRCRRIPYRRQAHRGYPGRSARSHRRGAVPRRSLPSLGGDPTRGAAVARTGDGYRPPGAALFASSRPGASAEL
jgi:Sigma-54 interaction domain